MTNIDLDAVIRALKEEMLQDKNFIALQESRFSGNEWAYVKECLDTGWVSSVGKFVDRFESDLIEFTGIKHVVAVVNGTSALHICLKLIGVERDDEVLVPALTFVATANASSNDSRTSSLVIFFSFEIASIIKNNSLPSMGFS